MFFFKNSQRTYFFTTRDSKILPLFLFGNFNFPTRNITTNIFPNLR